ncbi:ferrous iron transport protein B [Nanchangia anserum]|uniref:Ferrous iron transport protein B n=1 Tax=Nanchangia anserum TaxID=2692125 RepID=A0A8I0GCK8_9ACTO|nr:ferrous iron transport protein B [Nanchangia anserum]QOX82541.1 ferrous iron transport protein B [Nanchangia anserum]
MLVGNPNVGKSTLFNTLTGARQSVCNAPGTTVEVFSGRWKALGVRLIDTPGTYSLLPASPDEEVVVDTVSGSQGSLTDPHAGSGVGLVVAVLDATALSRSLYLLGQLAQAGVPVVCALTMYDVAQASEDACDARALEAVLGVPVVVVDPRRRRGLDELTQTVRRALEERPRITSLSIDPGAPGYNAHIDVTDDADVIVGSRGETERATQLFDWIATVCDSLGDNVPVASHVSLSDRIDRVLLNPVVGIGSFLAAMYLVFWLCNTFAAIFQDPFEQVFDSSEGWELTIPAETFFGWPGGDITLAHGPSLAQGVSWILEHIGLSGGVVEGIINGGLLTGIGVVASFAPLMIVMFIAIGMLEDSGYMARIAFLGDRLMRVIGLDGRVIMPFVVGFGCNLPTLAALRTLPNSRHRIIAVILTPYLTCNARLVVYLLIANVFFPAHTTLIVWLMYLVSVCMVVFGGLVLKPFLLKGESSAPLLLVLPPYQTPRALVTLRTSAQRTWAFLTGAGRVIVVLTIVVWLLMHIPLTGKHAVGEDMPPADSVYGAVAGAVSPVFAPAGFDDWHLTGGLITGFIAKETMLGSLAATYQTDNQAACTPEKTALAETYNPMSDADIDADLQRRLSAGDPEIARYGTLARARAAVDQSFTDMCVGLHLGTAEDDSAATAQMSDQLRSTLKGTAGDAAGVAAFAFLIFVLTYTPCLATVGEQWRQLGPRRTLTAVAAQLVVAWLLATLVFQIGRMIL